jgi:hypothetical protein
MQTPPLPCCHRRHRPAVAAASNPLPFPCCYRHLHLAAAAAAAAAATAAAATATAATVAVAVTVAIALPVAIAVAFAVAVANPLPLLLLSPSLSPKECAIHAAMERLLNGSCIGVNVATGPRGATDLNAIEEHWAKPIIFHPNKSSCENMAVGQGRTIGRKSSNHNVVRHDVDLECICRLLSFFELSTFFFAGQIRT